MTSCEGSDQSVGSAEIDRSMVIDRSRTAIADAAVLSLFPNPKNEINDV